MINKRNLIFFFSVLCMFIMLTGSICCEKKGDQLIRNKTMNDNRLNKFNFDQWKDAIQGPAARFHINLKMCFNNKNQKWNFANVQVYDLNDAMVKGHYEYGIPRVMAGSENFFRVQIFECNSIRASHETVLDSLMLVSRPNIDVSRPDGWNFGDVYKYGYWARDNVSIHIFDASNQYNDETNAVIKELNEYIDNILISEPEETASEDNSKPVINEFSAAHKGRPIRMDSEIELYWKVNDSDGILSDCYYELIMNGGRIECKNNKYYYRPERAGEHTIRLCVINGQLRAAKKHLVFVVE